jgi:hypothetical protein
VDIAAESWVKLDRAGILLTARVMRRYCRPGERRARSADMHAFELEGKRAVGRS